MKEKMKSIADEVMWVRDRLYGSQATDLSEERDALLRVRDQIASMVDEVDGETKTAKRVPKKPKSVKPDTSDPEPTALGQKIRDARDEFGLSRRALAEQAGVNELSLRKIEIGETKRPHSKTVEKISDALGVHLTDESDEDQDS